MEIRYFIKLISDFINEKPPTLPPEGIDWREVYYLFKKNDLLNIMFLSVEKLDEKYKPEKKVLDRLNTFFSNSVRYGVLRDLELNDLDTHLNQGKLDHIYIKGSVIKNYYPEPEARSMGDVDILIKKEDRLKSDKIIQDAGYKKKDASIPVWTYTKNNSSIEIHECLISNVIKKDIDYETYFKENAWKNTVQVYNNTYIFNKDFHLIYILVHLAKHFAYSGCGVRMIMDIAVYLKYFEDQLNWDYILKELELLDLVDFFKSILYICNKWFDTKQPIENCKLEEHIYNEVSLVIINKGIFGHYSENKMANRSAMEKKINDDENDIKYANLKVLKKSIFLPYKDMIEIGRYSFLRGKKYLILFAWIYRWIYILSKKDYKKEKFKKIINNTLTKSSIEQSEKEYDLLTKLGI